MRAKILCVLMTATLEFVSVSSRAAPHPNLLRPPDREEERNLESEKSRESAYTKKRWIGLRSKGIDRCPKVDDWTSESLLDLAIRKTRERDEEEENGKSYFKKQNASPPRQIEISTGDLRLLHKLKLDRYCIYSAPPDSTVSKDFPKPPGLVEAGRDRIALTTTSAGGLPTDSLGQKIWADLARQFREETGQEIPAGTFAPQSSFRLKSEGPNKPNEPNVRLTFVDSQPDGEWSLPKPFDGDSQHGFTLAHLAHGLVCPPSGPCAATIATRRALCYQRFNSEQSLTSQEIKNAQSGHMGLVSDLAAAILAEVLHWRDVGKPRHLILNLSLGWDGQLFRDLDAHSVSQLDPSVEAVYQALRFARRSGALVIAAAGNDRGREPRSKWPLLPAAWELRRPTLFHLPFGRKPVYAVGGVDSQGLSLSNTREGGQPRRVAYADHSVTAQAGSPNEPTAMYTGTSVSAAVASSIAAVVWHLRPELEPAQVMKLIGQSGDEVDAQVDFYAWKKLKKLWPLSKLVDAPQAKRLSLCSAVKKACGPDGKRCSTLEELAVCPPWTPKQLELAPLLATFLAPLPGESSVKLGPQSGGAQDVLTDISSERWTFPQPEDNPCPGCTLVPKPPPAGLAPTDPLEYELVLEISSDWGEAPGEESASIEGAMLTIDCPASGETHELTPTTPLAPSSVHRFSGLSQGRSLRGCRAFLTFRLQKGNQEMAVRNPVLIGS